MLHTATVRSAAAGVIAGITVGLLLYEMVFDLSGRAAKLIDGAALAGIIATWLALRATADRSYHAYALAMTPTAAVLSRLGGDRDLRRRAGRAGARRAPPRLSR